MTVNIQAKTSNMADQLANGSDHVPSIAFILPGLGAGGSEHVVTMLASHFSREGARVSIISFEGPTSRPYYDCDPGVVLRYLDVPVGRGSGFRAVTDVATRILRLRKVLKQHRPDLVISFLTRSNILAVLAGTGLGIPVIVSERNNPAKQRPGRIWEYLRGIAYPRAYGLVTMTQGAMNYFAPNMRKRSWVIPNMADWQHFKPEPATGQKYMTAVGRLTGQKGFDLLLQAFAQIAADHPQWTLRIWGEGDDRAELEQLTESLGISDRVEMPGVSGEPGSWIKQADAFVLSSRFEGWGLVLGEAMGAGLPCISFDCEWGPADMITDGDDGLLVADGNVDALADAMARVMADPELRERLAHNAPIAMERFSPDKILGHWQSMVHSVLSEQPIQRRKEIHVPRVD
ncbi:MAG: glycosyltransferase family 4 protein [Sphingorhabdus sp.]